MNNILNTPVVKKTFTCLDNWVNPIVVKEMRQAVRSRYIIILLQLYLALQGLMVGWVFLTTDTIFETGNGIGLFSSLIFLLFMINLFCVPIYTSNRLWKEVKQNDAIFSSTLTPMQIVRGKFFSGLIISLLLFSASIPFVMLTYLMRGLDMSTILLSLYGIFLLIQVLNSYGIVFGTIKLNPIIRAIVGVLVSILIITLIENGQDIAQWFLDGNIYEWIIITLIATFLCELFLILAGGILSPIVSNRMTRPRIFITGFSIILMIFSWLTVIITGIMDIFNISSICIFILMLLILVTGLCERLELSSRQIEQIPHNPLLRFIYFPFFTGVGSAVTWFIMMLVLMYTLTSTLFTIPRLIHNDNIFYNIAKWDKRWEFYFYLMSLNYVVAGLAIRMGVDYWNRTRLAQHISDKSKDIIIYPAPLSGSVTVLYAAILIVIVTIIPVILFYNMYDNYYLCLSPLYYHPVYNHDIYKWGITSCVPLLFGAISILFLLFLCIRSFIYYWRGNKTHGQQHEIGHQ